MNPFRLNYKKTEDKVTSLFVHVLEQCGLLHEFFQGIHWDSGEVLSDDYNFTSGLQLHNDFTLPVKYAFILGISNAGEVTDDLLPSDQKEGHPDAYFYDEQHQILILVEVKVGAGRLFREQIDSHKTKVKTVDTWNEGLITWNSIKEMFKNKLNLGLNSQPLPSYILNNFIGVLNEEVIGEYDVDYLIWLAQEHGELIKNILACLHQYYPEYRYNLPKGNHNEVRLLIGDTRVATFVLNHARFILHPGGSRGYNWRLKIHNEYGILYDQGDKYQNELSLPFPSIDPNTLLLRSKKSRADDNQALSVRELINQTFATNPKLRSHSSVI